MEARTLRERIEQHKQKTGFSSATSEEREKLARSLIQTLKSLDDISNAALMNAYDELKWGCKRD